MLRIWQMFIVFIYIQPIRAEVAVSLPRLHPAHPGQCYDFNENVAYNVGVNYPHDKCARVICRSDYSVEWQTCGSIHIPAGQRLVENLHLEYPLCCPMPSLANVE